MIVAMLLPPVLAVGWVAVCSVMASRERADASPGASEQFDKVIMQYEKYLESHP